MKSYPKGKDIKTKGDCLVYYFIKKIETTIKTYTTGYVYLEGPSHTVIKSRNSRLFEAIEHDGIYDKCIPSKKPEDFHKW
jgi:hypothetical protein